MRKNIYFEFFYLLSWTIHAINKRLRSYTFSGMVFLSMMILFNVITILDLIRAKWITLNVGMILFITAIILIINYYLLNYEEKDKSIMEHYSSIYREGKENKAIKWYLTVYVLISYASVIYTAYLVRHHLL